MVKRLKFHEKLYLSESISEKKLDRLKRKLEKKPLLANVYLIVPAGNPDDQLDIFDARQLAQPYYRERSFTVVGMASGYVEALQLIEQMAQDCMRERGDCRLREYLAC